MINKLKFCSRVLFLLLLLGWPFTSAAQIKPISIGEKCPAELLRHLRKLILKSNYKGNSDKAILIDFWATWCSPCVAALPAIDSLQDKHRGNLTILSVLEKNDDQVPEVLKRVFGNHRSNLTFVSKDTLLKQYFPHQTIPHYVWINKEGMVKTITDQEKDISDNAIKLLSNDDGLNIKAKVVTIDYNPDLPLYASKQAILKDELLYHSMVTKYRPDINTLYARGNNFITCLSSPILRLFQIAYGKFDLQYLDMNRVSIEGFHTRADSAELGVFTTDTLRKLWKRSKDKFAFSYELMVPDSTFSNDQLFEIMQQDLNRFFYTKGFTGNREKRKRKVIALCYLKDKRSNAFAETTVKPSYYATPAFIKMVNQPISFFVSQLVPYIKNNTAPLLNETGYNGLINIELNNTTSIQSINSDLSKYGLTLVEKEDLLDVVVILKNVK